VRESSALTKQSTIILFEQGQIDKKDSHLLQSGQTRPECLAPLFMGGRIAADRSDRREFGNVPVKRL
jgi:hypothetical protein